MSLIALILLAIGLAMDSLAVSIACGTCSDCKKYTHTFKLASIFGLFHILMPILGWSIGKPIHKYISEYDHWLAFALLSVIGIKMIYESLKPEDQKCFNINKTKVIISLALITSIDALIIGISLAFLEVNIIKAAIIFGIVNFFITFTGNRIGKQLGQHLGSYAEITGGVVLILLGIKIIIEHVIH